MGAIDHLVRAAFVARTEQPKQYIPLNFLDPVAVLRWKVQEKYKSNGRTTDGMFTDVDV